MNWNMETHLGSLPLAGQQVQIKIKAKQGLLIPAASLLALYVSAP